MFTKFDAVNLMIHAWLDGRTCRKNITFRVSRRDVDRCIDAITKEIERTSGCGGDMAGYVREQAVCRIENAGIEIG